MTKEFENRTNDILSGEDSIKTFFDRILKQTNNNKDTISKSLIFAGIVQLFIEICEH